MSIDYSLLLRNGLGLLAAAAAVTCGVLFVWADRHLILMALKSYRWHSTHGVIVDFEHSSFITDGIWGTAGTGVGPVINREIAYIYHYAVDGVQYRCSNRCFGGSVDKEAPMYHVGQRVLVYYDPDRPQNAVLKRGLTAGSLVGAVMIVAGLASGVFLLSL